MYYVKVDGKKEGVWKKHFNSFHRVTLKRVYRLSKLKSQRKIPCDLRGKAPASRQNVISGEYLQRKHEFAESLPITLLKEHQYKQSVCF
jgi:hypothetical protein